MKRTPTLFVFLFFCFGVQAQTDFLLVAQRGSKNRVYRPGAAVKITFKDTDTISEFRGRIAALTADSIFLRLFYDKGRRLSIAVNQLESVRRVRRVGRLITGVMAAGAIAGGIAFIADDSKQHGEFLDGMGEAIGTVFIVSSFVPYIVVAATEPVSKKNKGYRFLIVKEK